MAAQFCPTCANLLTITGGGYAGVAFRCRSCPYIYQVTEKLTCKHSLSRSLAGSKSAMNDADEDEALADKKRGEEYSKPIKAEDAKADKAASQLCLQADGSVMRGNPLSHFAKYAQTQVQPVPKENDPDEELRRLRAARVAQMQEESVWRAQGHGRLRELEDEAEFIKAIKPHERALVLLHDGSSAVSDDVRTSLEALAPRSLEAQFCCLHARKAFFLTQMVNLQGLPAIFILREGKVVQHLPPAALFANSSASSPLFKQHLRRLLRAADVLLDLGDDDGDASEESEGEKPAAKPWSRSGRS
mmetsp:Transcript_36233/g.82061  ORF Transcript_36233/g.82061 Transcript_36233/m.82061 type:complete len:302 (-) Transcript_36233:11-916(-)